MLYLVVALKAEAQAFVEKFKLKKSKLNSFTLYANQEMKLIISGMGVQNARVATQTLVNHFDVTDEDVYYNIGICGASNAYEIGEVLKIGEIAYENEHYLFDANAKSIQCVDEAIYEKTHTSHKIVDMESFGFYDAIIHNPAIKRFSIIKIVSDHFEPESVTKDGVKGLLAEALKREKIF